MPKISPTQLDSIQYYWEDLKEGMEFETVGRTITSADVSQFAGLTADYNRLHTNDEYAQQTPFKQRIAHGMLVGSIMSGLTTRTAMNQFLEPSIMGLLGVDFTFPKPTFIGDTIKVVITVTLCKETSKPDRGVVAFQRKGINQRGEVVCICNATLLVKRQPKDNN